MVLHTTDTYIHKHTYRHAYIKAIVSIQQFGLIFYLFNSDSSDF